MRKVAVAAFVYVAILAAAALWRWHVWSYGADTGLFTQAILDTFGGFRDGPELGSHLRYHWTPLIGTLWPLLALWPSGLTLQVAEAVLIAASAFPFYALARGYLERGTAFALTGLLLLYPPLLAVAFDEFHENAFFPFVTFALFWAADRAHWRIFFALAFVSAFVREEACIAYVVCGLTFAVAGFLARDRKAGDTTSTAGLIAGAPREPHRLVLAGFALAAFNAGALAYYFAILTPSLGGWAPGNSFYNYPFAHGPVNVVLAIARRPANGLALVNVGRFTYLLEAFAPLAFLPLFSRWTFLALPAFAGLLLSSQGITWRMGSHYAAMWVPWVFVGVLATIVRWRREGRARRVRVWPRVAAGCCIVVLLAFDPLHPLHYLRAPYPIDASVRAALAGIPPSAHVLTHDEWLPHIAARDPYATMYFCSSVDYAVLADDYPNDQFRTQTLPAMQREIAQGRARVLRRFGSVVVYARTPPPGPPDRNCRHVLSR